MKTRTRPIDRVALLLMLVGLGLLASMPEPSGRTQQQQLDPREFRFSY